MTDEATGYGPPQPGVFDDDRLLACALGLDDDPELLAAAEADPALGSRLAAMRAQVAAVGSAVRTAVPAPDEEYTELADARWAGLRTYLEPPRAARSRSRASRWLRVATPVAAVLVLALVAGLAAVDRGADTAMQESERAATETGALLGGAGNTTPTFSEQLDAFAVVVLARARAATGAVQRFAVVRVFKGDVPRVLELDVGEAPAESGRLHLLLLRPLAVADAQDFEAPPEEAAPLKAVDDGPGRTLAVAYRYQGEPAVCRELPTDTDPASVTLP